MWSWCLLSKAENYKWYRHKQTLYPNPIHSFLTKTFHIDSIFIHVRIKCIWPNQMPGNVRNPAGRDQKLINVGKTHNKVMVHKVTHEYVERLIGKCAETFRRTERQPEGRLNDKAFPTPRSNSVNVVGMWLLSISLSKLVKSYCYMMTSSNGNIFRVTGHLCGEFTGPRWIPHTKASDAELWCFLWCAPE